MVNSVRARLTLWYVFVFGLLLLEFSVLIYVALYRSLYNQVDRSVSNVAHAMATEFIAEIIEYKGDARTGAAETLSELRLPDIYTAIFAGDHLLVSNFLEARHVASSEGHLAAARAVDGI